MIKTNIFIILLFTGVLLFSQKKKMVTANQNTRDNKQHGYFDYNPIKKVTISGDQRKAAKRLINRILERFNTDFNHPQNYHLNGTHKATASDKTVLSVKGSFNLAFPSIKKITYRSFIPMEKENTIIKKENLAYMVPPFNPIFLKGTLVFFNLNKFSPLKKFSAYDYKIKRDALYLTLSFFPRKDKAFLYTGYIIVNKETLQPVKYQFSLVKSKKNISVIISIANRRPGSILHYKKQDCTITFNKDEYQSLICVSDIEQKVKATAATIPFWAETNFLFQKITKKINSKDDLYYYYLDLPVTKQRRMKPKS